MANAGGGRTASERGLGKSMAANKRRDRIRQGVKSKAWWKKNGPKPLGRWQAPGWEGGPGRPLTGKGKKLY